MSVNDISTNTIHTINASSIATTLATFFGWLPPFLAALASAFTVAWMALQIYESRTYARVVAWVKDKTK